MWSIWPFSVQKCNIIFRSLSLWWKINVPHTINPIQSNEKLWPQWFFMTYMNINLFGDVANGFLDAQASLEPTMSVCPCVRVSVCVCVRVCVPISLQKPISEPNEVWSSWNFQHMSGLVSRVYYYCLWACTCAHA